MDNCNDSESLSTDQNPGSELEQRLDWQDVPALIGELHQVAARLLARWPGMQSLQPTLLVTTALRRQRRSDQSWDEVSWANRRQFFGQVHRAMVQKLVEYRRYQRTRGYQAQRRVSVAELELYENSRSWSEDPETTLALEAGLRALEQEPRLAQVVQYRFFADLSESEIAEMLELDPRTVRRDWAKARILMEESIRAWWAEESS
jgi:DNA-directed RNA polymerase specialized sigma24 family protein